MQLDCSHGVIWICSILGVCIGVIASGVRQIIRLCGILSGRSRFSTSLVPSPCRFWLHEESEGPGIFSHVHDVRWKGGRKDLIEHGSEQQEELRYQVTYHMYMYLASRGDCHTLQVLIL